MNETEKNLNAFISRAETLGCEVIENAPMKDYVSFCTGGPCLAMITPESEAALQELLSSPEAGSVDFTVLGNGSNCLVPDEGINGIVIRIADGLTELRLINETQIFCGAGVKLITLCNFALMHSLSGLEFAYGIPGSAGGAAFMNAGAYGGEMKDVLSAVHHITRDGKTGILPAKDADLSYRHSVYEENGYIITGIELTLTKSDKAQIKAKMDELLSRRKDKQPLEYPSAGSTFKRPQGYYAGALIEECGLKGFSVGGAAVSEKHAGFVINKGGATSGDILSLIEQVQSEVKLKTGVTLEPEVRILES